MQSVLAICQVFALCLTFVAYSYGDVSSVCHLPPEVGPCKAQLRMFFYSNLTGKCEQFFYGGCEGNQNRFLTSEQCHHACVNNSPQAPVVSPVDPVCSLPVVKGQCRARIPRYAHVGDGQCQLFYYGGCGGNRNNFASRDSCKEKCGTPLHPANPTSEET